LISVAIELFHVPSSVVKRALWNPAATALDIKSPWHINGCDGQTSSMHQNPHRAFYNNAFLFSASVPDSLNVVSTPFWLGPIQSTWD
jgi:hypothetical protein